MKDIVLHVMNVVVDDKLLNRLNNTGWYWSIGKHHVWRWSARLWKHTENCRPPYNEDNKYMECFIGQGRTLDKAIENVLVKWESR